MKSLPHEMTGELFVSLTKVELVGENWFQLAGPALLALAAIVAALVAAYVAIRNHKTQLEHNARSRARPSGLPSWARSARNCFTPTTPGQSRLTFCAASRTAYRPKRRSPSATSKSRRPRSPMSRTRSERRSICWPIAIVPTWPHQGTCAASGIRRCSSGSLSTTN